MRCVLLLLVAACGGRAQPASPSSSPPACDVAATPAWVRAVARDPDRLACAIDPARGLTSIQLLGCEREPVIETSHQLCGADVASGARALQADLARELSYEPGDERITCTARQCVIPASGECRPEITLVFGDRGRTLTAIVERDDWQARASDGPAPQELVRHDDAFVDTALAQARCN